MTSGNGSVKLYYKDGREVEYELRSIRYELTDKGVALCTWNEPATLNSLTDNLVQETFVVLEHMKRDPKVLVAMWTGAGRAWGAGASMKGGGKVHIPKDAIKEYLERGMAWKKMGDFVLKNLTLAFWDFPKPSVAAVHGTAVGGAVNMALCNFHDFVICADNTRFKYPFVKLGVTPELSSSRLLPFVAGFTRAKELLLLGEFFSAEHASRCGLVTRVVPTEAVQGEARELAARLAGEANQPALRLGKRIINHHVRKGLSEILDEENKTIFEAIRSSPNSALAKM